MTKASAMANLHKGSDMHFKQAICIFALFAGLGMALELDQSFPLEKVPSLTRLIDYEAAWSPDAQSIALISNRHGGLKVHILDATERGSGSTMHQITSGPDEDDSPAWSHDGKQIAFVSIHNAISDIFVINADGGNQRQVTRDIGQNIHPMWSPDGLRILFNTTHYSEQEQGSDKALDDKRVIGEKRDDSIDLATIRPDGTDLKPTTHGGGFTYASFSPDGKMILHRRQHDQVSQIFLMNADGSNDRNLSGTFSSDGWPSWSPDGQRIVFSRHTLNGFQIFVMNRDGSNVRQLTNAAGEFVNARWSPDGRAILCGRRLGGTNLVLFDAPT